MDSLGMAGHLIRRLNQLSTQIFMARTQALGFDLTPVQFAAMDAISHHPGSDQATIAQLIAYDRATIGGVIERLVKKGLVMRSVSAQDKRARELTLSEEGESLMNALVPSVMGLQDDIMRGLNAEERHTFEALARKALSIG